VLYVGINDTDLNKHSYAQFCYGALDVYDQQKLFADPVHYQSIASQVIPRVDEGFVKDIASRWDAVFNNLAPNHLVFNKLVSLDQDNKVILSMIEAQKKAVKDEIRSQFVQGIIKTKSGSGFAVSELLDERRVAIGYQLAIFLMDLSRLMSSNTMNISVLIHAQQENNTMIDLLHNNVKIDSYITFTVAQSIKKAPPIITLTSTPQGILYSRGFLKLETTLRDSDPFLFTLLRSSCLHVGEPYQCGEWGVNKYRIERSNDQIVDVSVYKPSSFESKAQGAPSSCATVPQGINNTEGTCFLNGILQLWRAIYCVPGIADEMVFSSRSLNPQENKINAAIYKAVMDFLNNYSNGSSREREDLLKIVHDALAQKNNLVGLACHMVGRAHLVMEIMHEALTKYPALIDCTKEPSEYFNSNIGVVLNNIECKERFKRDEKEIRRHLEGDLLKTFENSLKTLFEAQEKQGYAAIQIARAAGLDVFSGKIPFDWPLVLIVATTRFNKEKNEFEKLLHKKNKTSSVDDRLGSVLAGEVLSQFSVALDLSTFDFSSRMKKPPVYELMALEGKFIHTRGGHVISVIKHNNDWFYCSNQKAELVPDGNRLIHEAARTGKMYYQDFKNVQEIYPEILVYRRKD